MKVIRNAAWAVVAALALLGAAPAGADYEAGKQAWDAGHPSEALAHWQAAAAADDRRAMLALGRLYAQGVGVLQDYVEAHKWFNLAAGRGEAAAAGEREALAAKMTPQQVEAAQSLARSWRPGGSAAAGTAGRTGAPAAAPAAGSDAEAPPPRGIREAQSLLAWLGYAPGPADGLWGRRTARAYRLFLAAEGLPPAQRLTPEALRAMRAMVNRAGSESDDAAPAVAAEAPSNAEVPPPRAIREAQGLLAGLGYAPGPADGTWDRSTARAYRLFLAAEGLPPAQRLTPEALRVMRATAQGHGAQPAAPPRSARPPDALHGAAKAGDVAGLQAALAAGVDVDALDGRGWTALMYAANKGYPLLVEPLLAADADPNVRAPDGATALFIAALHGQSEVVAQLLKAGADQSVQGPKGRTPLEVAQAQGSAKVTALLQEVNARKKREAAISKTKSLDTLQAYQDFLKTYCPDGDFCKTAQVRRNDLLRESITGSIFRGVVTFVDNYGDLFDSTLTLRFVVEGKFALHARTHRWDMTNSRRYGSWNIEDGRVRMRWKFLRWRITGTATLSGDVLAVNFSGYGQPNTWSFHKVKDPDEIQRVEDLLKPNANSPQRDELRDAK